MRETWQMMRKIRIAPALLLCLVTLTLLGAPAWANPFETLPADHWAYDTVKTLSKKGFLQRFIEDRLHLGYRMTYFDVAMWLGEAFQRHQPDANGSLSLGQLVDAFNESSPTSALTQQERLELADLIALVRDPMEILGYPLPRDIDSPDRDGIRLDGVAKALEQFRMRGESRIVYQDVQSGDRPGETDRPNLEQSHTLRLSGPVSPRLNIGAVLRGESRLSMDGGDDEMFRLGADGIDLGVPGSGIARFGRVTGAGLSDLAVGEARELSGFQAALQTGQVGSVVLVARPLRELPASGDGTAGEGSQGLVTAWDGSVQLNDRLQLGATVAYLQTDGQDSEADGTAVVSVGGTYFVTPQLTVTTEMAQNPTAGDGRAALRIGAVLHPLPELTLGALLSQTQEGFRPLLSSEEVPRSRIDLSAEIGRWILSLRREHLVSSDNEDEGNSTLTRLGVESRLGENAILRAARETGEGPSASGGETRDKTEVDLEIRFELGKLGVGFALESAGNGSGSAGGSSSIRRTHARIEHAVGPIGRASAGFSIVDQEVGNETSSNVGIRYDFDNASVMLQYEIFTKVGEVPENVTTAEVSIKF